MVNIYNPRGDGPRIRVWPTLERVLQDLEGEVLLLGDFNVHHPAWGGTRAACEPNAEHLCRETQDRNLHLITPPGIATWKRGLQETVIDLTFASEGLSTDERNAQVLRIRDSFNQSLAGRREKGGGEKL